METTMLKASFMLLIPGFENGSGYEEFTGLSHRYLSWLPSRTVLEEMLGTSGWGNSITSIAVVDENSGPVLGIHVGLIMGSPYV